MPINPIQRKTMTSFFLGVLVMLIIAVIIAGLLYITVFKKDKEAEKQEVVAYVYALNQDVTSGQEITSDMVQEVKLTGVTTSLDLIPSQIQNPDGSLMSSPMVFGYKSKINLSQGTILSMSMLYEGEQLKDGERLIEYNMITLPIDLSVGDYIDIRLTLANGQDLVVLSKKEIKNLFGNTISLYLTEEEMLMMNSAIVEAYIMPASNLHAIKYIEPGNQGATQLTYVPTTEVQTLMSVDPNITSQAWNALTARFTEQVRTDLNIETGKYSEDRESNIEEGIQSQIEAAREAREAYLSGLEGN